MNAVALSTRSPSVVVPGPGPGVGARQGGAPRPRADDGVVLSDVARSLSGEARDLFAAFSGADRTQLAQLVESGAVTAQELGDGLVSAVKGSRKLQLWQSVFDKISEPGASAEFAAEQARRHAALGELDELRMRSERLLKEMTQLVGKPQSSALSQKKADELRALHDQMYALQAGELMDLTRPMTFVGTSGIFLSANWQSDGERAAEDKLAKLGAFSVGVKDVIAAAGKKAALENIIVRQVGKVSGGDRRAE